MREEATKATEFVAEIIILVAVHALALTREQEHKMAVHAALDLKS